MKKHLLAKWLPRQSKIYNNNVDFTKDIIKYLNLTPKQWRKQLVELTKVVETQMCNKEWKQISYSGVPSIANVKYNKAFLRNDEQRRREFLAKAIKGEVKIQSTVAYPNDVLYRTGVKGDWQTATAMWNQLPDYLEGTGFNILPICDVSGSMSGTPMEVSISLGIYLSERNKGLFKDTFMTFSGNPKLQVLKGNLKEKYMQLSKAEWERNTNLEKVFSTLLGTAVAYKVPTDEMPSHLLIISDMAFDRCVTDSKNVTLFEHARKAYQSAGYEMPNIIFWNVDDGGNVPIKYSTSGVGLVSGYSPSVMKAVLSGEIDPVKIMVRAVVQEKYQKFIA